MAARGASAADRPDAAYRRLMNVGDGEWSPYCVTRSPETRGRLLNLEIHRRYFPAVLFDLILDVLSFIERAQSSERAGDFLVRNGAQDMLDPIYACAPFVF